MMSRHLNLNSTEHTAARDSILPIMRTAWIVAAVFILTNSATPLYSHWQHSMGFSSGTLTLIFGSYMVGLLLTLTVSGQLADHFGRKAILIPCIVLALVATLIFRSAASVEALILARFLTGVAVALVVSAGMANIFDHAKPSQQNLASLMASIAMTAGCGLGPLFSGALTQMLDAPVHLIFNTEIVLILLTLIAVLLQGNNKMGTGKFRPRMPSLHKEHVRYVAMGIAFFAPGISSTSFGLSLAPKLMATYLHSDSPMIAGLIGFGMFTVAVIVQLCVKGSPAARIFVMSGFSTLISMSLLWVSLAMSSPVVLVLSSLFAGAGMGWGQLGGMTLIGAHVQGHRKAEATAIMNIGAYIPAGALPVAAGYIIDFAGIKVATMSLIMVIAATATLSLLILLKTKNRLAPPFPAPVRE